MKPEQIQEALKPHVCESDGLMYTSNPPQWRCKICGKFEYVHNATMKPFTPDYLK